MAKPQRPAAGRLDLANPVDAVRADRKIHGSANDGEVTLFTWQGRFYSRVEGERDRHLFDLVGMNIRQCGTISDAQRGDGYRLVGRELMLYLDPADSHVLRRWNNPWTGKTVDVLHVANDPVSARAPVYPLGADGAPFRLNARLDGGKAFVAFEIPLFYPNPLGGAYQQFVGGHYHAMEIFDFAMDLDDLLDAEKSSIEDVTLAWVRIAPWLPWMEMGARPGLMIANATGRKLKDFTELPPLLRDEIVANHPEFQGPPALDDLRPSETSWTYFKKFVDQRRT